MKNTTILDHQTLLIEKFIPGGQALTTLPDGKKLFLWNALPGEIISKIEIKKQKTHYAEGIALDIQEPSPYRTPPQDACYLSTSPWQILTYDFELSEKAQLLQDIFAQQKISVPAVEVKTDHHDYHYRNKMEYALYFDHAKQTILPAFHARGSHQKVPITQSSLEHPAIFQRAQEIIRDLNQRSEEARDYQSLLLRSNQQGEVSGGLYKKHQPHPSFPILEDQILGYTYRYSPNGFFQINLPVYEMALREIQKWIQTEQVLDLYAGVGTIGLSVARERNLTLVECDKSAWREMVINCQQAEAADQLSKFCPVLAKSEEALSHIESDQTVILDPPRAGCQPPLLARILEVQPRRIIYLSCNPITQARDVRVLQEKYKIAHIAPYNFFPHTPHLENLIVLDPK